ncbi:MAG: hypothetical protein JKY49_01065 [Cohaesibacteraceae bacterium]|nr:hypothetical protein [Cohaesibacteraceae bacterium]MBL4876539.1 hypothetical protein [Cohaesibacteraceae bacterium]
MIQALLPVAQSEPLLFSANSPLDKTARKYLKKFSFDEIIEIRNDLRRQGIYDHQLSKLAFDKYQKSWLEFPLLMIWRTSREFRVERQLGSIFSPWDGLRKYSIWKTGSKLRDLTSPLSGLVFRSLSRALSGIIMLPFYAGILCSLVLVIFGQKHRQPLYWPFVGAGCVYLGFLLVFALSHLEMRYVGGVTIIPLVLVPLMLRTFRTTIFIRSQSTIE